ncbi:MAG TPA: ComEA family DNA-binding protein [Solirubrobacterales bacterium]|nr:ComEA family DNA-binding protein [Solirubrobacterales bacterium]
MPELSRAQVLVYGAIAVALLLVGARWIRSSEPVVASGEPEEGITIASPGGGARGGDLVVHVAGEVRKPGIYELRAGSRVADAVESAGGATGTAALDGINLAATLADGQQVVVPARARPGAGITPGATAAGAAEGPFSLGTATVEQLETIEGIGPVTAAKIVEFRDQRGGVGSIEELEEIHGIGPATIDRLRERLQP